MILIFGKNGQIGRALQNLDWGEEIVVLGSQDVDFTNPSAISSKLDCLLQKTPRILINASAYTAVDKAESEPEKAYLINAKAVEALGIWANSNGCRVVHYSTDYVYPGTGEKPWLTDDPKGPLNTYGASKLEGEKLLLAAAPKSIILRISWVVSEYGHNFLKTMLRLGREKDELKIVCDQIGSPMSAHAIARITKEVIGKSPKIPDGRIYNLSSQPFVSWYEFAESIFESVNGSGNNLAIKKLVKIPSSSFPTPARRPLNSRMSDEELFRELQIRMRPWKEDLTELLERLK